MRFQSVSIGNITNNSIYKSDNPGLLLYDCDNTTVSHNLFLNNSGYAFEIDSESEDITIHHNTIIDNGGTSSQAKSDSAFILWYDVLNSEGNFWSDWSGSGSYLIDGIGLNEDLFPLGTSSTTTSSSSSSTTNSTITNTTTTSSPGQLRPWMIALITIVGGVIILVVMVFIVKKKKKNK